MRARQRASPSLQCERSAEAYGDVGVVCCQCCCHAARVVAMIRCEMLSLQHLLVTRPHHIEKEGFQMRWGLVGLEALLHSQM